jgi:predicted SAM-dependent methyltransferase
MEWACLCRRLEGWRRSGYDEDVSAVRDHHVKRAVSFIGVKLKLLIGSRTRYPGWKTLDFVAGPKVDYVADCLNLTQFGESSIEALYASHVREHVPYADFEATLTEWHRVLMPSGKLIVAVPDINIPAQLFVRPEVKGADKILVMQIMFGGQTDDRDFHCTGFDLEILSVHLHMAGFEHIRRVPGFSGLQHPGLLWHSARPEC